MGEVKRPDGTGGVDRMFDSEWLNVVNHADCYRAFSKEDAVHHAVKMTEQAMARHANERAARLEREHAAAQAELTRLRAVEAEVVQLKHDLALSKILHHAAELKIREEHGHHMRTIEGVRLAAKDGEVAELRARLSNAELQRDLLQNQSAAFLRERDEARECVGRLWRALDAVRVAGMETCIVERDGHDDQIAAVNAAIEALAATPEHLRK